MNNKSDLYNVQNYTDEQLFQILDLDNPTDRELEAKIHHMIWKYSNFQNDSGKQLMFFFQDIYDHFFDDEQQDYDDNGIEGMDNMTPAGATAGAGAGATSGAGAGAIIASNDLSSRNYSYSIPIDYSKDNLNPLLKQTIKRIVSIESKFRENSNTTSTNFTLNLATPLKDVVSLKLYSYSIPYNWYTISNSYGSNFFYIKGNTPGINDGNYIFQIKIDIGNYTVEQLIDSVNVQFKALQNNTSFSDISFGTTGLTYNKNTSKSTLIFDIKKIFNETSYELYFTGWTTPNAPIESRNTSIPSFFGFNYGFNNNNFYMPYTASMVRSVCDFPLTYGKGYIDSDFSIADFKLDLSNNWFNIIQYLNPNDSNGSNSSNDSDNYYDVSKCTIIDTYSVKFSLKPDLLYSRYSLYQDIRTQLANNIYLQNSSLERVDIDISENIIGNGFSQYQLNIELNRFTTKNVLNSKLVVEFPNDTIIWLGPTSAFHFVNRVNDLSTITSETNSVESIYVISRNPTITFKCNNQYYKLEDIVVDISSSPVSGYSRAEYIKTIDEGFANANVGTIDGSNPNGIFDLTRTAAFINYNYNSVFQLNIDLTRRFTNSYYTLKIDDNSILKTLINIPNGEINLSGNVNTFTSQFRYSGGGYTVNSSQNTLLTILPSGIQNADAPPFVVEISIPTTPSGFYTFPYFSDLETAINQSFTYYIDNIDISNNINPLSNCNISLVRSKQNSDYIDVSLNISVVKVLIQKDYTMTLGNRNGVDISWNVESNSWYNYCYFTRPDYDLSDLSYNIEIASYSQIPGSQPFKVVNTLVINKDNNTIYLVPKKTANGLYTSEINANSIVLTLPIKEYTRSELIDALNKLLSTAITPNGQPIARHSFFKSYLNNNDGLTYTRFRFNINKVFTGADFLLIFYDPFSFTSCFTIAKTIQNTTWDSTLGWILGFRNFTQYNLNNAYINPYTGIVTLTSDTTVSVYIYNSFLIILDDYNQNYMNDGVVTTSRSDTDFPLPSYTSRATFFCDNNNNKLISLNQTSINSTGDNTNVEKRLTQKQIYGAQEILNNRLGINNQINSISNSLSSVKTNQKYFSNGPFAKDVFAFIPLKLSGIAQNSLYTDFSGTLQNQERVYFGPVKIHRFKVTLLTDRGEIVDLIGADWSFSLLCEQLYQQSKT